MTRVLDLCCRLWAAAGARLGLRGVAMLLLGVGWVLISQPAQPRPPGAFLALIPQTVETIAWAGTGLFAIATAATPWQARGVATLSLMPMIRLLSFLGAWLVSLMPDDLLEILPGDPIEGSSSAWRSAVIYAILLGFVLVVANIREVPKLEGPPHG